MEPAEPTADQDVLQRHPVVLAGSKQAPRWRQAARNTGRNAGTAS